MMLKHLERSFFNRDPLPVAKELPGTWMFRRLDESLYTLAEIVEVRAFEGIGRKMYPEGMRREHGTVYVVPYRGVHLLNITTTRDPSSPSCVWIYEAVIKGSIYKSGNLSKMLKIDMGLDGMSIEGPEIFLLKPQETYDVEEVKWRSPPPNYVGGYRLREIQR